MTPTTIYPPLPWLAPRLADETAEQYGLRALLFVTAERITLTVDTEGLELAQHVFRLAVSNRGLTSEGAERLADVGRLISGQLRRRQALDQAAEQAAPAPASAPTVDRPNLGPMAPLSPPPTPQAPPSAARKAAPAKKAPGIHLAPVAPALAPSELF